MTEQQRDLLLRDLSARLPYGVIFRDESAKDDFKLMGIATAPSGYFSVSRMYRDSSWEDVKPYLRPLSSMTDEECEQMQRDLSPNGTAGYLRDCISIPASHFGGCIPYEYMASVVEWLYARHFDIHNLIWQGLAIEVTGKYNPYKNDKT